MDYESIIKPSTSFLVQALEVLEKCDHDLPTAMESVFSQGLPKSELCSVMACLFTDQKCEQLR